MWENRFSTYRKLYTFEQKNFTSVLFFSRAALLLNSKQFITLSKNARTAEVIEKLLFGGYSGVATQLVCNTKMINEDEGAYFLFDNKYFHFYNKILKVDENNQYGYAMAINMPYAAIDLTQNITIGTVNDLLKNYSNNDKIGYFCNHDLYMPEDISNHMLLLNKLFRSLFIRGKLSIIKLTSNQIF